MPLHHPAEALKQEAHVRQLPVPGESSTEIRTKKNAHPQRQPKKSKTGAGPSCLEMMDAVPLTMEGSETQRVRDIYQRITVQQAVNLPGG